MSESLTQVFAYEALDETTRAFLLRKADETRGLLNVPRKILSSSDAICKR